MPDTNSDTLKQEVIKAIRTIIDPEIPVNIYDLGLIYDIQVDANFVVNVRMTLTSPTCPIAEMIVKQVELRINEIESVSTATVELVWEPTWTADRMSEAARLTLNLEPGQSPTGKPGQQYFDLNRPR